MAPSEKSSPVREASGEDALVQDEPSRLLDPVLDRPATSDGRKSVQQVETSGEIADGETDGDGEVTDGEARTGRKSGKVLGLVVLGLLLAAGAIYGVSAWSSKSSGVALPATDAADVVTVLSEAGFDCSSTAVVGDVGTCGSTIAVRVFPDDKSATDWVLAALTDPLSSSAVGWVGRGNVIVTAPIAQTPAVAEALGEGARSF